MLYASCWITSSDITTVVLSDAFLGAFLVFTTLVVFLAVVLTGAFFFVVFLATLVATFFTAFLASFVTVF